MTTHQTLTVRWMSAATPFISVVACSVTPNCRALHLNPKMGAVRDSPNTTVAPLYLDKVMATLASLGCPAFSVILPDGEEYKSWETLNTVFDALLENRCERGTTLIALGGGVIGDLVGFSGSLLSARCALYPGADSPAVSPQVDSSVGGKTAINHPLGKNMIGAFYQPKLVLADLDTLDTLPSGKWRPGCRK